jgi:cytochrome c oxidase subunit 2
LRRAQGRVTFTADMSRPRSRLAPPHPPLPLWQAALPNWRSPGRRRIAVSAAAAAAGLWHGTARAQSPSILDPASPNAAELSDLYLLIFYIGVAVFVLVEGLILYAVVKFRRKSPADMPDQVHGNTNVEIAWTVTPAVIVLALAAFSHRALVETFRPPADALTIEVNGHQWWWEFGYPPAVEGGVGFQTATELVVPVGRPVVLNLDSVDVVHSFWVPQLAGKTDAIPGERDGGYGQTRVWFVPDEEGTFEGQCAEFCGTQHAGMRLLVQVVSVAEYEAWHARMSAPAGAVTGAAATGLDLLTQKGCQGCHRVEGVPAMIGVVGPNLTHVGSRSRLAGGVIDNTPENLRAWIADPQAVKPGTLMPDLALTPEEVDAVAAYLESLQ